jgi:hypothetical protein
VQNALELIESL